MKRVHRSSIIAASAAVALLSASGAPAGSATTYQSPTTLAGWPTYHHDAARSGHVLEGPTGPLQTGWSRRLRGQVYGEPLVVGSTLLVATERDFVYGLDARTGVTRWRVSLGTPQPRSGLPCGDISPLGITGTPAYDRRTGSLFVTAETRGAHHTLWALNARTGARRWHRSLDVLPHRNRFAEQQRGALLVTHGRVITTFGGLSGDCSNYVGYVTSVSTSGAGATHHYSVPTRRGGGIWATPGPVLGFDGDVYASVGNGAATSGRWDKSDSVTELSPRRLVRQSAFAPASWRADNLNDLDLGSSSPAMVPGVRRVISAGKRGVVYLLRAHLGGVGSAITSRRGCRAFGGTAVVGSTALVSCLAQDEVRALHVGRSSLSWSWTAPGIFGAPVVAGDRVYLADRRTGDLVVLRLSDGSVAQRIHAGPLTHFPSQVVSGDWVFVPTMQGVTALRGK